jgi:hypothetical protein
MNLLTVLAQSGQAADNADGANVDYGTKYVLLVLDKIWQQVTAMTWLQSVIAISFGVIVLLYGWRIYKTLTVIGFGVLGLHIGLWIGAQFGKELVFSIIVSILLMVLAMPLVRWAVCILGAVAGGVITAGIWHACYLPQEFVWAGALIGIVAGGMLSFIVFRLSVMLFTGFGGSSLVLMGVFSLIYRYETFVLDPPTTHLNNLYYNNHWFLPALIAGFTLFGIILQLWLLKGSKEWTV